MLHEAPGPLRLIVLGHVGCILAWSSSVRHWLLHVWWSFLIEIQFIRTAIKSQSVSYRVNECLAVYIYPDKLCSVSFHLINSSSLKINNFMLIFPLFVSSVVFIWQSFRLWTVYLFSYSLVCACAFNIISVRTYHFPELTFSLSCLYLRMHFKYIKICFHIDCCSHSPVISLSGLFSKFWSLFLFYLHVLKNFHQLIRNKPRETPFILFSLLVVSSMLKDVPLALLDSILHKCLHILSMQLGQWTVFI